MENKFGKGVLVWRLKSEKEKILRKDLQFSNTVYIALLQGRPDQATIEQVRIKNRITNGSGNFCR